MKKRWKFTQGWEKKNCQSLERMKRLSTKKWFIKCEKRLKSIFKLRIPRHELVISQKEKNKLEQRSLVHRENCIRLSTQGLAAFDF